MAVHFSYYQNSNLNKNSNISPNQLKV